jgi:hypothetical protein
VHQAISGKLPSGRLAHMMPARTSVAWDPRLLRALHNHTALHTLHLGQAAAFLRQRWLHTLRHLPHLASLSLALPSPTCQESRQALLAEVAACGGITRLQLDCTAAAGQQQHQVAAPHHEGDMAGAITAALTSSSAAIRHTLQELHSSSSSSSSSSGVRYDIGSHVPQLIKGLPALRVICVHVSRPARLTQRLVRLLLQECAVRVLAASSAIVDCEAWQCCWRGQVCGGSAAGGAKCVVAVLLAGPSVWWQCCWRGQVCGGRQREVAVQLWWWHQVRRLVAVQEGLEGLVQQVAGRRGWRGEMPCWAWGCWWCVWCWLLAALRLASLALEACRWAV